MHAARILPLLLFLAAPIYAATYYVDSTQGDDTHLGTDPAHAWQSFAPVSHHTFAPGDSLLLRAGSRWEGTSLQPGGSGSSPHPITIDRYGDGPAPVLAGAGRVPVVLRLNNQSGWIIRHLDLSNQAPANSPLLRGIEIHAADAGVLHTIVLQDLVVHDVTGPTTHYNDGDAARKSYGGIAFLIDGTARPTAWDDVRIERCTVRQVSAIGIVFQSSWNKGHRQDNPATWLPSTHVILRGNTIERTAHNGLIIRVCTDPLIEHNLFRACAIEGSGNACFAFDCDRAVFQYNEACGTKYNPGDSDASGFDSDWNCRGTVIQYNFSHDNDYGFALVCCLGKGFNDGTVVRGNVSLNDGGNLIRISGTVTHTRIYGNTLYARPEMTNPKPGDPPRIVYFKSWQGWSDGVEIFDNTIVNSCAAAVYELGKSQHTLFRDNRRLGLHPASEVTESGTKP